MIKLIKIQGLSETYPEEMEGTHEWYAAREPGMDMCDLYEAEEIFEKTGSFKGMNYHLIHYPDGEVHSPFQLQENVYVDKPVWNDGVLNFLVVDFKKKLIIITEYIPVKKELRVIAELSLSEVEDGYNLMLETSPLMLGRSPHDGYYEIVWPENKRIPSRELFLPISSHKFLLPVSLIRKSVKKRTINRKRTNLVIQTKPRGNQGYRDRSSVIND